MTNRSPLVVVSGRKQELPSGDLLYGGGLVKQSVSTGDMATVPTGYSMTVAGDYIVDGDLVVDGDMRVFG